MNLIQRFPQSKDIDICVLDAGLTSEQKNILSKKVNEIKKAEWDIEIPMLKHLGKEWLKSWRQEPLYQNTFHTMKSIFGLIVMRG